MSILQSSKSRQLAAVTFVALTCLSSSGCGGTSDNPDVALEQGHLAASAGEMESAVRHFTKALEKTPDRSDIAYERGRAYEAMGLFEKAIADYDTCLQAEPGFEGAINNKGVCYAKSQQHLAAIEQFSLLISRSPSNGLALRNRGLCHHHLQQFDSALADYDAALELASEDAEAWFQRGNVFLKQELHERAIADYSEAIKIAPDFSKAWMNRGVALFGLSRPEQGMQDLLKAQQIDSSIVVPELNWVKISQLKPSKAPGDVLQFSESATTAKPNSATAVVAKPVFNEAYVAGWKTLEQCCRNLLTERGFDTIAIHQAVPGQLCGTMTASRHGIRSAIFVGVKQPGSRTIRLPATVRSTVANAQLLVMEWDQQRATFANFRFVENWKSDETNFGPATVELQLSDAGQAGQ